MANRTRIINAHITIRCITPCKVCCYRYESIMINNLHERIIYMLVFSLIIMMFFPNFILNLKPYLIFLLTWIWEFRICLYLLSTDSILGRLWWTNGMQSISKWRVCRGWHCILGNHGLHRSLSFRICQNCLLPWLDDQQWSSFVKCCSVNNKAMRCNF